MNWGDDRPSICTACWLHCHRLCFRHGCQCHCRTDDVTLARSGSPVSPQPGAGPLRGVAGSPVCQRVASPEGARPPIFTARGIRPERLIAPAMPMAAQKGRYDMPDSGVTIPAWVAQDIEWASTIHALRAPALAGKHLVETYVDFDRHSIEWDMLLKAAGPWSTGERQLVALAFGMWSGRNVDGGEVSIMELVGTLDETNLGHVLDTIRIRRSWKRFEGAEQGPAMFDLAVRIEFLGAQLITLENELDAAGLPVIRDGAALSGFVINTLRPITSLLRETVDA